MSSLSLSILILAVLVALVIAAQSLWVLRRDRKRFPPNKVAPVPANSPAPASPVDAISGHTRNAAMPGQAAAGEPRLSLDDIADLPASGEPAAGEGFAVLTEEIGRTGVQGALPQATADGGEHALAEAGTEQAGSAAPLLTDKTSPSGAGFAGSEVAPAMAMGTAGVAAASTMAPGHRVLHDEADCLVEIPLLQPMSGDKLLGLTKSIRRAGGKPVAFEGLSHWPEPPRAVQLSLPTGPEEELAAGALNAQANASEWEALRHGVSYKRLRAGILLSNRQGSLNSVEYEEFGSKLKGLAAQLGVPVDMPESIATLQRAKSLDNLLADCDVQLGLAVDCSHAIGTTDLAALAKRLSLFERGNNRYACLSESGEVIYTVALGEKSQRLQLMFDVPRVAPAHMPWWKMAEAAHQAALQFEGRITDDGGRELSEQSFRNVAIALEGRQQALAEAGVPAGSALALRVFN